MLLAVKITLQELGMDYFLVGAIARDIQLSARPEFAAKRKTNDVDIAVLIDDEASFDILITALCAGGEFEPLNKNSLKLMYRNSIELDILPFGAIEDDNRMLGLNIDVLLSMEGFREVWPFVQAHRLQDGTAFSVCPLEGLVLLKLLANDENPSRTKDISDIEHIISVYFELNADDVYENYMDIMNSYETDRLNYLALVAARIIGRKINLLIAGTPGSKNNLLRILAKRPNEISQAMLDGLND